MITSVSFKNFRVLRDASIELGPYNVVIGPNGSGKSTLLAALKLLGLGSDLNAAQFRSVSDREGDNNFVVGMFIGDGRSSVGVRWVDTPRGVVFGRGPQLSSPGVSMWSELQSVRIYSLDERAIASAVPLQPVIELAPDGAGLAGVLDRMRDENPEQFEALNEEVARLLPEFDRILFDTPGAGMRSIKLRLRGGHGTIRAADLSQGTLLALALLTIAYLPNPPAIIGIEEPDRGIHPRLYRDIQAALYRLAYPESFGLTRDPVQVIVTTHSPFLLDLHRDTPEEIIIAEKTGTGAEFHRLIDRPELTAILDDVSLGEAWYSGVLGGVPAGA